MLQNPSVKLILIGLVFCIFTHALMFFLDYFILTQIGKWAQDIFSRYLIFHWTTLDRLIIRWFPLFITGIYIFSGMKSASQLLYQFFWITLSILMFFLLAVFVALFFWTNDGGDSPLLPDYLRYQPFANYWTLFIALGILLPLIPFWTRKEKYHEELID